MPSTIRQIQPDDLVKLMSSCVIVDVRTPAEYEKGHIPESVNLPLFTNDERAAVGTTYKQVGQQEAIDLGLEIVGPKMAQLVRKAREIAAGRALVIYCWRGGMRSGSVAWLLQTAGLKIFQLTGGYKQYRKHFYELLNRHPWQLVNLGGRTGSGKTEILHQLHQMGQQVIDLEGIANHRGSAYGALGLPPQPTNEQFENLLHDALTRMSPHQCIWVESESQGIGHNFIPDEFYERMQNCLFININIPIENRIQRLVRDYACFPKEMLRDASLKIKKRLGGLVMQQVLDAIDHDDFASVARLTLGYYDKTYDHGFALRQSPKAELSFDHDDTMRMAQSLMQSISNLLKTPQYANH
ncbi:MAG: tRNA 2-selenouridine(34) synthase MnmH [Marinilabiliaceae bacterium]|nr:tRNA 2-selenouridine(34) synthase MnmH [Marinilabiliaceae bacterium]